MKAAKGQENQVHKLSLNFTVTSTLDANGTVLVSSPTSIEDRIGMRLTWIDYHINLPSTTDIQTALGASDDKFSVGLSFLSAQPTGGFKPNSPGVIEYKTISRKDWGTAANAIFITDPYATSDLTKKDPEGLLCHPSNLYYWFYTHNALAQNVTVYMNIWYRSVTISDQEWEQLWKQIFVTQAM